MSNQKYQAPYAPLPGGMQSPTATAPPQPNAPGKETDAYFSKFELVLKDKKIDLSYLQIRHALNREIRDFIR